LWTDGTEEAKQSHAALCRCKSAGYKKWENSNVSINRESPIGKSLVSAVITKHDIE
jgi:hypothetical protein